MKQMLAKSMILSVLSLSAAMPACAADTYQLDPNHTNIYWHANHFGFSTPSGKFATVAGTLTLNESAPQDSKVEVTITTGSVVTGIDKFNTHLKSKDFFNSEQFPTATFVSDKVDVDGNNKNHAQVHGMLTLLGVSKPVTLDVTLNKIGENPMTKIKTAGFSATTTVKRSEFGMNFGVPNVSDDVQITIEAEANLTSQPK